MSPAVLDVPNAPSSPEADPTYVDRMVAKAEGKAYVQTPAKPVETPKETPEGAPKVDPPAKADEKDYKALYEELLQKQQQEPPKTDEPTAETPEEKAAKEALQSKGLDITTFEKEFQDTGALTEESYKKLAEAGLSKEVVDSYIEGQKARAEVRTNELLSVAKSPDRYSEMLAWAKANLSADEIKAYNEAVVDPDMAKAKGAVQGLYAKFTENVGEPPNLLKGEQGATVGDVFKSKREMIDAMRDPRYNTDSDYRKEVEAKVGRSKNIF